MLFRSGGANAPGAPPSADGIIGALSHTYAQPPMGYGFPLGGDNTSSTFPPLGSMYPGYDIPSPFSPTPTYLTATHPNPYPYPQPGVPAPPAFGPLTPLPSQPPPQHLLPPPGHVFAQHDATNYLPSQRNRKGTQSAPGNRGLHPLSIDPHTTNQP